MTVMNLCNTTNRGSNFCWFLNVYSSTSTIVEQCCNFDIFYECLLTYFFVFLFAGPTLKLKRPVVAKMYKNTIEAFYIE